jgi:hypothetical protein
MLIAPPFGLLAPDAVGSKDLSAFADHLIIWYSFANVKDNIDFFHAFWRKMSLLENQQAH